MTSNDAPDEFGPAMLALDERRRKFVLARAREDKNQTQAAQAAGYSQKSAAYLRVQGHRLMHEERVVAALAEELRRQGKLGSIPLPRLLTLLEKFKSELIREAIAGGAE